MQGLNLRPSAYQAGALPAELIVYMTTPCDLGQVWNLSRHYNMSLVRDTGLEPAIPVWKTNMLPITLIPHGAPRGSRTLKTWFLRPVCIPIPSPAHWWAMLDLNQRSRD